MKTIKGILLWIASLTWGLPLTLVGLLATITLLITGHKPKRFHQCIYFTVGHNWGGVNFGPVFIVDNYASEKTWRHECGHGLQNIMLGPLMPFVIAIPSAIRYWYRVYLVKKKKKANYELPPYDSIWFEGWATKLGDKYYKTEVK